MINIHSALSMAVQKLGPHNHEAHLEAELLLSNTLNKNRAFLYAHPETPVNEQQLEHYFQLIDQRVRGKPIAYITQSREFWSLSLKVTENTLIPRHETERLVELALELIPNKPNTSILDLGTGSGAIALAIASERPLWNIDACDISQKALDIAKENAQNNKINNVNFYHSDWFNNLPEKKYQAILSNPPYIAEHDPHLLQGDVRFEPRTALSSGQEGLADLQYIIKQSCNHLLPNGLLLLEHGYDQKSQLSAILKKLGYKKTDCWKDLQGHYRVSGGWYGADY